MDGESVENETDEMASGKIEMSPKKTDQDPAGVTRWTIRRRHESDTETTELQRVCASLVICIGVTREWQVGHLGTCLPWVQNWWEPFHTEHFFQNSV